MNCKNCRRLLGENWMACVACGARLCDACDTRPPGIEEPHCADCMPRLKFRVTAREVVGHVYYVAAASAAHARQIVSDDAPLPDQTTSTDLEVLTVERLTPWGVVPNRIERVSEVPAERGYRDGREG